LGTPEGFWDWFWDRMRVRAIKVPQYHLFGRSDGSDGQNDSTYSPPQRDYRFDARSRRAGKYAATSSSGKCECPRIVRANVIEQGAEIAGEGKRARGADSGANKGESKRVANDRAHYRG
jgi:hypothetical protein